MNFFQSQDKARSNTGKLVLFFVLAIISLIALTNLLVLVAFGYLNAENLSETTPINFNWEIFWLISAVVIAVITFGSLYKIMALSGGGARVAEMMDAALVVDGSGDINKQKILNVVEEMAIASGMPVPPVYLIEEDAINAFAAGYSPSDAVIGVTRGTIEKLSRDELQGVIAHEFSHIFNGDMRLNIRLIGILNGIMILGFIGYFILRSSSRSRSSKNGGGIVFLGIGLMVIGFAGTFFGNLIKAAVSRQREYLADASAVQFTRNPNGIAGALKRIGGDATGSILENPNSSEISHALFSQGVTSYLSGLFATHPPLEKRIKAIQPNWDGQFEYENISDETTPVDDDLDKRPSKKDTVATIAAVAAALETTTIINNVGQVTQSQLDHAHELLLTLPETFKQAVREPFAARAIIYYLVLDKETSQRDEQLQYLQAEADTGVYAEIIKLVETSANLKPEHRLPLVDMALSTLRQLSAQQYQLFSKNLKALVAMDSKISLLEWSIKKIVFHHLDAVFNKRSPKKRKYVTLRQSKEACAVLLSLLVYAGKQDNMAAKMTFNLSRQELGELDIQLLDKDNLSLDKLNTALDKLTRLKPLMKPQLLRACVICITADKTISPTETVLFRAIADTLDCPLPPLLV